MDMGITTGASLDVTESFAVGLDFRYMWNLTNKVNGSSLQKSSISPSSSSDTPIEQLSYWSTSLVGKLTF
jgi:hypothetical protein